MILKKAAGMCVLTFGVALVILGTARMVAALYEANFIAGVIASLALGLIFISSGAQALKIGT